MSAFTVSAAIPELVGATSPGHDVPAGALVLLHLPGWLWSYRSASSRTKHG